MLTESEARLWGGCLTAIGTAVMACGFVRVLWPAADVWLYLSWAAIGFGFPLLVAGYKWIGAVGARHGVDVRLDEARAWASELANREREARLEAPAPAAARAPDDDRGWYIAVEITLLAGQVSGFTDEGLGAVLGSDGRPAMQRFLAERGLLALRPGSGYGWAEGVTLADALRRLRLGELAPFPAGWAPEVKPPVRPATRRDAPRQRKEPPPTVVIEGEVRA